MVACLVVCLFFVPVFSRGGLYVYCLFDLCLLLVCWFDCVLLVDVLCVVLLSLVCSLVLVSLLSLCVSLFALFVLCFSSLLEGKLYQSRSL